MSKIDLILKAIKAGVSAPKIIAKYGKQAYNAVKKSYDKLNKAAEKTKIVKKLNQPIFKDKTTPAHLITTATVPPATIGVSHAAGKLLVGKDKKKEKKLEKNKGGSVNSRAIAKKYFKGGMV